MGDYYDRDGNPIDLLRWGELHSDVAYKRVAAHHVRGWFVSTVWLGIDHGFGYSRAPIIFETMIFPPADVTPGRSMFCEDYQDRYATEAAAHAGHDRALAHVCEQLGIPVNSPDVMTDEQFAAAAEVPDSPESLLENDEKRGENG